MITRNCPEVFRSSKVILQRICLFTQSYLIVRNNFKMLPSIGGSENWARKSSATIMLKLQSNFWSNISLLLVSLLGICLRTDRIPYITKTWERLLRENIEVNTSMIFLSLSMFLSPNPVKRLPVLSRLAIFMAIWPVCIFQPMRHAGPAGGKSDQLAEFYEFKTLFLISL